MKTNDYCIILLTFVPENIIRETEGGINNGMYLRRSAVDCLLRGEMFSGLDCMSSFASPLPEDIAMQACKRLFDLGMGGFIIHIG